MNRATTISLGAGLCVLGALLLLANHWQHVISDNLPPREECTGPADAGNRAAAYVEAHGGTIIPILGTGSMAPYIPASGSGKDPMMTIVAFVVTVPGARFVDITAGNFCPYKADWLNGAPVMHVAAQHDGLGWIMSGLHNTRSEPHWRVTEKNFLGIAAITFTWPQ